MHQALHAAEELPWQPEAHHLSSIPSCFLRSELQTTSENASWNINILFLSSLPPPFSCFDSGVLKGPSLLLLNYSECLLLLSLMCHLIHECL